MQSAQFQLHADIEQRHWWFVARRQILRRLVEQLVVPGEGNTIVDIGCGTGANLASLAQDYRCVGIDTSAEAIGLAQHRFPDIRFVHGQAPDDLNDVWPSARLVLLTDVMEHVPDDFSLLSSLLEAAQEGTYFVLTVPADMALWSRHDESFGHFRRYDRERLRRVWQGLPVSELLVSYYNSRLYPLVHAVRRWNRLRGCSAGRAGTDFSLPPAPLNRLLESCLEGEGRRLTGWLQAPAGGGYRRGVSLVAVLRREAGPLVRRTKPLDVAADFYDPAAAQVVSG